MQSIKTVNPFQLVNKMIKQAKQWLRIKILQFLEIEESSIREIQAIDIEQKTLGHDFILYKELVDENLDKYKQELKKEIDKKINKFSCILSEMEESITEQCFQEVQDQIQELYNNGEFPSPFEEADEHFRRTDRYNYDDDEEEESLRYYRTDI